MTKILTFDLGRFKWVTCPPEASVEWSSVESVEGSWRGQLVTLDGSTRRASGVTAKIPSPL